MIAKAILLGLFISAAFLAATWCIAGWTVTKLPCKPWMWPRSRREAVLSRLAEDVRAGRTGYDAAMEAYRKAVGMDYLVGPLSHAKSDWYGHVLSNAAWERDCNSHGWIFTPLEFL